MLHENPFIVHASMFILFLGRKWAAQNNIKPDAVIYQVGQVDVNRVVDFPKGWPYFYAENDEDAQRYFTQNFPSTRHLIRVNLAYKNPRKAVQEVQYGNSNSGSAKTNTKVS